MGTLQNYQISFFRKDILDKSYYGMNSISPLLDQLVTDDQTVDAINETLDAVGSLLQGEISELNYTSQSLNTIIADSKTTSIYDDPHINSDSPCFTLPTADFKSIIEAWKVFVQNN